MLPLLILNIFGVVTIGIMIRVVQTEVFGPWNSGIIIPTFIQVVAGYLTLTGLGGLGGFFLYNGGHTIISMTI